MNTKEFSERFTDHSSAQQSNSETTRERSPIRYNLGANAARIASAVDELTRQAAQARELTTKAKQIAKQTEAKLIIDAEQQIYADRWSFKFEDGSSYLYQLKDLKRRNLAQMSYISKDSEGEIMENLKKRTIEVMRIDANDLPSKPLETLKNPSGFEESNYPYMEYWKKNWKNFVK